MLRVLVILCATASTACGQSWPHRYDFAQSPAWIDTLFDRFGTESGAAISRDGGVIFLGMPNAMKLSSAQIGFRSKFQIDGDFQIDIGYEILHMPTPSTGHGLGAGLCVDAPEKSVMLFRSRQTNGEDTFTVVIRSRVGENERFERHNHPADSDSGGLMIRRNGGVAEFGVSDAGGTVWRPLERVPFESPEPLTIRVVADSGGAGAALAARFASLRIGYTGRDGAMPAQSWPEPTWNGAFESVRRPDIRRYTDALVDSAGDSRPGSAVKYDSDNPGRPITTLIVIGLTVLTVTTIAAVGARRQRRATSSDY